MAYGSDVAVVLRARRGRNILVQTHGIDIKAVMAAAGEVSSVLENDLPGANELVDSGGLGASTPALGCGHLAVGGGGRLSAVYRLVGGVLVIALSRGAPGGNVCASLNLVAAVTRLIVAECKTVDVTASALERRYAQVYLSVSALVARGSLDVVQALLDCNRALAALSGDANVQRRLRAQQEAARDKALEAGGELRQIEQRLPPPQNAHAGFVFGAPPDITSIHVALPAYPLPEFPAPDRPRVALRPPPGADGADGKKPPGHMYVDGAFEEGDEEGHVRAITAADVLAAEQLEKQKAEDAAAAAAAAEAEAAAAAAAPAAPAGPPLRLEETWRCEVLGGRLLRAGASGAVRWVSQAAKAAAPPTPFRLQVGIEPEPIVATALKCVAVNARAARPGAAPGCFVADSASPQHVIAPLLRYDVPASFGRPPLLAHLSAGLVRHTRGAAAGRLEGAEVGVVLLTLTLSVPEGLAGALNGAPLGELVADVCVPGAFGAPRRVEPPGAEFCNARRTLRWRVPGGDGAALAPGWRADFVAAFRVDAGIAAASAALCGGALGGPGVLAIARLRGAPGTSLTGAVLALAPAPGESMAPAPGQCEWSAIAVARPFVTGRRPAPRSSLSGGGGGRASEGGGGGGVLSATSGGGGAALPVAPPPAPLEQPDVV